MAAEANQHRPAEELVQDLSASNFSKREEATLELWWMGEAALPLLDSISQSEDPERAARARDLKRKINYSVRPDSPPEVLEHVEQYKTSNLEQKREIIKRLKEIGSGLQALHLFAEDSKADERLKLKELINGVAREAARKAIDRGEDHQVSKILMMAPAEEEGLAALASYFRVQGKLQDELERAKLRTSRTALLWQLALAREAQDIALVKDLAQQLDDSMTYGVMCLLEGDPVPLMEAYIKSNQEYQDTVISTHERLSLKSWKGEDSQREAMKLVKDSLKEGNQTYLKLIIASLAYNTYLGPMEKLLLKDDKIFTFKYLESRRRLDEAFALYDFEDTKEGRQSMAEVYLKKAQNVRGNQFASQDFSVPALLAEYGEIEKAREILDPAMSYLKKHRKNEWQRWLRNLRINDASALVIVYANEDIQETGQLSVELRNLLTNFNFRDLAQSRETLKKMLWLLRKEYGNAAFDKMAILYGWGSDEQNQLRDIEDFILKNADDDSLRLALIILGLTRSQGDIKTIDKVYPQLEKPFNKLLVQQNIQSHYLDTEQWERAERSLRETLKNNPTNSLLLMMLMRAQKGLGDEEGVKQTRTKMESLQLADATVLARVAQQALDQGESDYALEICHNLLSTVKPNTRDFRVALELTSKAALQQKNWKLAAACYHFQGFSMMRGDPSPSVHGAMMTSGRASLCRGMHSLEMRDELQAKHFLSTALNYFKGTGIDADDFFPNVNNAVDSDLYSKWFHQSYDPIAQVLQRYPKAHNVHNGAAWVASRAEMELEKALDHATSALEARPYSPAYLDTMAEVHFAKGNREKALEYSNKAIKRGGADRMMWQQYRHFRDDPLPER